MNDVKIRDYNHSDRQKSLEVYDAAMPLAHPFLEDHVLKEHRQHAEEFLDYPGDKTFVLIVDGQLVGFSTFIHKKDMAGFFIDPNFQGRGLGKYLIEHIKSQKDEINLAVYKQNSKAIDFYQRNSFRKKNEDGKFDEPSNAYYLEMFWKANS